MSNELNNNQHYVTESFVKKRFGVNGFVQRYDLVNRSWKHNASPQFVFSSKGYTQLLIVGEPVDNSLEIQFSKVESNFDKVLPLLDEVAGKESLPIDEKQYQDLCWYCSFLLHMTPFAKAKAPANFVMEIDHCLKIGNLNYLRRVNLSDDNIKVMQQFHAKGFRYIIEGENYLQNSFREQFIRHCDLKAATFRYNTKWTVFNSEVELPISDIAIIDVPDSKLSSMYILPISSDKVLVGQIDFGPQLSYYKNPILYGDNLPKKTAQDMQDLICLSGIKTIACKKKIDIETCRERATRDNVKFTKVTDARLETVLGAGRIPFDRSKPFRLVPVSTEKFAKFVHSYVTPAK